MCLSIPAWMSAVTTCGVGVPAVSRAAGAAGNTWKAIPQNSAAANAFRAFTSEPFAAGRSLGEPQPRLFGMFRVLGLLGLLGFLGIVRLGRVLRVGRLFV